MDFGAFIVWGIAALGALVLLPVAIAAVVKRWEGRWMIVSILGGLLLFLAFGAWFIRGEFFLGERLVFAARSGNAAEVRSLLSRGAFPNATFEGESAIQGALEGGYDEVVKILRAAGARLDTPHPKWGEESQPSSYSESATFGLKHVQTTGITNFVQAGKRSFGTQFSTDSESLALRSLEALKPDVYLANCDGNRLFVTGELDEHIRWTPAGENRPNSEPYRYFRLRSWYLAEPFMERPLEPLDTPLPQPRWRTSLSRSDFTPFPGHDRLDLKRLVRNTRKTPPTLGLPGAEGPPGNPFL